MKEKLCEYKYLDYFDKEGFVAIEYRISNDSLDIVIPKDKDFKEPLRWVSLSKKETRILYQLLTQYYSKGE